MLSLLRGTGRKTFSKIRYFESMQASRVIFLVVVRSLSTNRHREAVLPPLVVSWRQPVHGVRYVQNLASCGVCRTLISTRVHFLPHTHVRDWPCLRYNKSARGRVSHQRPNSHPGVPPSTYARDHLLFTCRLSCYRQLRVFVDPDLGGRWCQLHVRVLQRPHP